MQFEVNFHEGGVVGGGSAGGGAGERTSGGGSVTEADVTGEGMEGGSVTVRGGVRGGMAG